MQQKLSDADPMQTAQAGKELIPINERYFILISTQRVGRRTKGRKEKPNGQFLLDKNDLLIFLRRKVG